MPVLIIIMNKNRKFLAGIINHIIFARYLSYHSTKTFIFLSGLDLPLYIRKVINVFLMECFFDCANVANKHVGFKIPSTQNRKSQQKMYGFPAITHPICCFSAFRAHFSNVVSLVWWLFDTFFSINMLFSSKNNLAYRHLAANKHQMAIKGSVRHERRHTDDLEH